MSHLIVPERTQLKRTDGLTTIVQTYITYLLFHYLLEQIAPDSHCCNLILSTHPSYLQEQDYGTIMCWADNAVGQQREPCVFHLIAAGKPEMPYNCSLVNQTSESLEVNCGEGN